MINFLNIVELQKYNNNKIYSIHTKPNKNKIKIVKIRTNTYNFLLHLILMDLQNYNTLK